MHIVIGLITAVAGLIWALHSLQRAGVDLNAFNPFTWYRRRKWGKSLYAHPAFSADNPMDIAAVLLLHAAKLKGELTRETRTTLLSLFQSTFKIDAATADDLFAATSFKLKDGLFEKHTGRFIKERWEVLTPEQAQQIAPLVKKMTEFDGEPNASQIELTRILTIVMAPKVESSW